EESMESELMNSCFQTIRFIGKFMKLRQRAEEILMRTEVSSNGREKQKGKYSDPASAETAEASDVLCFPGLWNSLHRGADSDRYQCSCQCTGNDVYKNPDR